MESLPQFFWTKQFWGLIERISPIRSSPESYKLSRAFFLFGSAPSLGMLKWCKPPQNCIAFSPLHTGPMKSELQNCHSRFFFCSLFKDVSIGDDFFSDFRGDFTNVTLSSLALDTSSLFTFLPCVFIKVNAACNVDLTTTYVDFYFKKRISASFCFVQLLCTLIFLKKKKKTDLQ